MKISAIIPTYYKNEYKNALKSILNQKYNDFEVIVVKNGSHKKSSFARGNLRIYEIKEVGLDNARNFGIKKAKGEIVVFIDDDAIASPNWLEALNTSHSNIRAPVIGGKVLAKWPKSGKPKWIRGILLAYLSILEGYSTKPSPVHPLDWLAGANISFKKSIFNEVGLFDKDLDRKGKLLLSSGEVELCNRIRKKGYEIIFDPSIVVTHIIPETRLNPQYMVDRAYWQGISNFVMDKKILSGKQVRDNFKKANNEITHSSLNPENINNSVCMLCKYAVALGYLQAYLNNYI